MEWKKVKFRGTRHPLADRNIIAEHDWCDIVAIDIVADRRIVAHRQIPRLPNLSTRLYDAALPDLRAEEA